MTLTWFDIIILDMANATTLTERTEVAGIQVEVREMDFLLAMFKRLGGTADGATDKSIDLHFPTERAANEFKAAAVTRGAIFD